MYQAILLLKLENNLHSCNENLLTLVTILLEICIMIAVLFREYDTFYANFYTLKS